MRYHFSRFDGDLKEKALRYLRPTCEMTKDKHIKDFLTKIQEFNLFKAEKLSIINMRPSTLVELHLVRALIVSYRGILTIHSVSKTWKRDIRKNNLIGSSKSRLHACLQSKRSMS